MKGRLGNGEGIGSRLKLFFGIELSQLIKERRVEFVGKNN